MNTMSYPSIITQPGASARNISPILEQLHLLLADNPSGVAVKTADASGTTEKKGQKRILEIGSYPYEHIRRFAEEWPGYEWWGSGRTEEEIAGIGVSSLSGSNLRPPIKLDIGEAEHWAALQRLLQEEHSPGLKRGFEGILMINIIHCCPVDTPEGVFRHASTTLAVAGKKPQWIAAYAPWLNDDGTYKTAADEEFDKGYIRAKHPSLGLRTISSIDSFAEKWGYAKGQRTEMPKGNTWVVWRARD